MFPSLALLLYGYLGWRLAGREGWGWAALALPFLAVLSFPVMVARRSAAREERAWEHGLTKLAYAGMALVSFFLVATLARDLAGLLGWQTDPRAAVGLAFALFLLGSAGGFFGPRVRTVKLPFAHLPAELRGLRIALITDLHLSSHIGLRYVRRVVRRTSSAAPDLVMLTGDIGDGHVEKLRPEIEALRTLKPAFYATGNHEVYWNFPEWMNAFRSVGMRVLLNEGETVTVRGHQIFVAGITDPACAMVDLPPDLAKAAQGGEGAALRILLSHRPDPAEEAARLGFDLQLSGHTHGGQFFPWTIVAQLVHRYSLGLYAMGKSWVYVSPGTGSWGPRVRLGTRAEITILEL